MNNLGDLTNYTVKKAALQDNSVQVNNTGPLI